MNHTKTALLIALILTLGGMFFALSTAKSVQTGEIQGARISPSEIQFEHQSQRLPENSININSLLLELGKLVGQNIIEIFDATYLWKSEANTYEILGKSIEVKNSTESNMSAILNHLKESGFNESELNTYTLDGKDNIGFIYYDNVCLVRTSEVEEETDSIKNISTNIKISCGLIDYTRIKEQD